MTLEQVIQLGQIDLTTIPAKFLFIGLIGLWVLSFIVDNYFDRGNLAFFLMTLSIVWAFTFLYIDIQDDSKEQELITKWKNEVAYPYINSLPTEKHEIVYIKIDPELSHDTRGYWYTYSVPIKLTPLTVSFKYRGVETYTDWYETHMELTDERKPYIEFKELKYNLGNGVNVGMYNKKVYLPESYEFTDIK